MEHAMAASALPKGFRELTASSSFLPRSQRSFSVGFASRLRPISAAASPSPSHSTPSTPPLTPPTLRFASASSGSPSSGSSSAIHAVSGAAASELAERERAQMEVIWRLASEPSHHLTVAECMTQGNLIVARETTTIHEALLALVEHRITGMPVVDDEGRAVGVVSDYDLLALDSLSGALASCDRGAAEATAASAKDLFPAPTSSWQALREIQKLLRKAQGQTVGDVMTPHPLTLRPQSNLEDAARMLLASRHRRLLVVDDSGRLLGMLTRGNVVRAALILRRAAEGRGAYPYN